MCWIVKKSLVAFCETSPYLIFFFWNCKEIMGPTSSEVIEILIKLSEINSRKIRNFENRSWRNSLYYYRNFEKNINKKPKQKKKKN